MVQYLVIFKILATCGSTFALQGCSKSKKNKSQGGNASTVCDEPVDRPGNRWLNRYGGHNPHGAIGPRINRQPVHPRGGINAQRQAEAEKKRKAEIAAKVTVAYDSADGDHHAKFAKAMVAAEVAGATDDDKELIKKALAAVKEARDANKG